MVKTKTFRKSFIKNLDNKIQSMEKEGTLTFRDIGSSLELRKFLHKEIGFEYMGCNDKNCKWCNKDFKTKLLKGEG